MVVLSLCDGMSCGQIALENLRIDVNKYYASEIKETAIKVTMKNYPDTIQLGDVNKISYSINEGIIQSSKGNYYEPSIDLLIFGSPCQDLSVMMNNRQGLNGEKSSLFYKCYQILLDTSPKYFLMENVSSMSKEDKNIITSLLGVEPIFINSKDFTGVSRKRYYWTNIPIVQKLKSKNVSFQDVITNGYVPNQFGHCLTTGGGRPLRTSYKMLHRFLNKSLTNVVFKDKETYDKIITYWRENNLLGKTAKQIDQFFETHDIPEYFDNIRYLTQEENEKCQGVPKGYTNILSPNEAANVLGDGWTVPVIEYLFQGLKNN